jgi:hypothetical protein
VLDAAMNEGEVGLFDATLGEFARETAVSFVVACGDQNARSVLVEPVNDARPSRAPDRGEMAVTVDECVGQGPRLDAGPRMHDESGRFVHRNHVFVLVQDCERNRLGRGVQRRRRDDLDVDRFTRFDPPARPDGTARRSNPALGDVFLNPRPAQFRQLRRQPAVQPLAGIFGGHNEAPG